MTQDGEELESKGQAQSSNAVVSEFGGSKSAHTAKEDEKIDQKL